MIQWHVCVHCMHAVRDTTSRRSAANTRYTYSSSRRSPPVRGLVPLSPYPLLRSSSRQRAREEATSRRLKNGESRSARAPLSSRRFWRDFQRMRADVARCYFFLSLSFVRSFVCSFARPFVASELPLRSFSLHNDLSIACRYRVEHRVYLT